MKIIVAPDSFKGSLTALAAADSIARGILRILPHAQICLAPLGDGGEGTVDALVAAIPGSRVVTLTVTGPLGTPTLAHYGLLGDGGHTAVVEMAAASGITLVDATDRNPLLTSTFGTGELIADAANQPGVTDLILGLGGSATNDGGTGALQALGVEFIDESRTALPHPITGGDLARIAGVQCPGATFGSIQSVTLACDVTNPLVGPCGASAVFGPQKGATPDMVSRLDKDLTQFAKVLDRLYTARGGKRTGSIADIPGAGAAGGLSAGLLAFFPSAALRPGIDIVLDTVRFDEMLDAADWVITGEGKLDGQTLSGKAIDGVLRRTRAHNVPAIAFAGVVDPSAASALAPRGLRAAYGLMEIAASLDEAMSRAGEILEDLVAARIGEFMG